MSAICFFLSDSHRVLVKYCFCLKAISYLSLFLTVSNSHLNLLAPSIRLCESHLIFFFFLCCYTGKKETPGETSFHTAGGFFGFLHFMVILGMLGTFYGFCYKLTDKFHPKVLICQKVTRWACSISTNTKECCLTYAHFQNKRMGCSNLRLFLWLFLNNTFSINH